jgi:8-hydroxy-5-deazaflavin:NADPH oxidoreductase
MTVYGVLGTGTVGRALAGAIAAGGRDVRMGTRDVEATRGRAEPERPGLPSFAEWIATNDTVALTTFAEAIAAGDILVNATSGSVSIDVLGAAGSEALDGKILIDIGNPLDFSSGELRFTVAIDDSLGETIQRTYPGLRVVKALNMVTAAVMVDPGAVAGGDHTAFIAGNDDDAKTTVGGLLRSFGWIDIQDLGDIAAARGMEAYLVLWLREMQTFGTPMFNVKLVR